MTVMYGSAGFSWFRKSPASWYARWAAPMSASQVRRSTTLGLRPCAAMPRYRRAGASAGVSVRAKNESRRSGPCGGKTCVWSRANSAWIWSPARRTVAVEAMTLGRTSRPSTVLVQSRSMAAS